MIYLELPFPPSLNHMYRRYGKQTVLSGEARAYKQEAAILSREIIDEPLTGRLSVTIRLYRPAARGDIDNYLKALLDALNGILWQDDRQIVELHVYKLLDREDPHAQLEIRTLGSEE